ADAADRHAARPIRDHGRAGLHVGPAAGQPGIQRRASDVAGGSDRRPDRRGPPPAAIRPARRERPRRHPRRRPDGGPAGRAAGGRAERGRSHRQRADPALPQPAVVAAVHPGPVRGPGSGPRGPAGQDRGPL
ncbi:MAG: ATP:Cob(I)alamin adenosyltransferase, partial [uncultured Thermomicrobiales bacterium]